MKQNEHAYSARAEIGKVRSRRSLLRRFFLLLHHAPVSVWFGLVVVLTYGLIAIFTPFIAPYGEAEIFPIAFGPWDDNHVFGTDHIGRDVLTRLFYGARNTISIALITTTLAFLIGGSLGLIAAINRSW